MCLIVGQKGMNVFSGESESMVGMEMGGSFFTGEFLHTLDPKNRLTIPSEWREMVGEPRKFYVLPALDSPCLSLYRVPEFMRKLAKLRDHSIADPKARQMARVLGSRSDFIGWDSAGRVRIKDDLLEDAGLKGKVVMLGALDRIELWSPEEWKRAAAAEDMASLEDAVRYVNL